MVPVLPCGVPDTNVAGTTPRTYTPQKTPTMKELRRRNAIALDYAFSSPEFNEKIKEMGQSSAAMYAEAGTGLPISDLYGDVHAVAKNAETYVEFESGDKYGAMLKAVENLSSVSLDLLLRKIAPLPVAKLIKLGTEGEAATLAWVTAYIVGFYYGVE